MVPEAKLEQGEGGLTPASDGWFVVNVAEATWVAHDVFGYGCIFDSPAAPFPQLGINVRVLRPGQPNAMYHSESVQEDFLVVSGECTLVIEGEERRLKQWDFVHCPPETCHVFVGGDGPCIVLMVGVRGEGKTLRYPVNEVAARHGASVEVETTDPKQAYASVAPRHFERPTDPELPWR